MGLRRINFDNALFVMDSGSRFNKFVFDLLTFQLLLSYSSIIYDYLNSLKRSLSRFDITGWYSINGAITKSFIAVYRLRVIHTG